MNVERFASTEAIQIGKGSGASTLPTPIEPSQRIQTLDIIRGIAVFGLAWVHLTMEGGSLVTPLDRAASWIMGVIAEKKFQAMFALLFGISAALQMDRARARGEAFAALWLRRMLVLYAIGWLTAIFILHAEILRSYALAGVVLLAVHRLRPRALLVLAALFFVLWFVGPSLSSAVVRLTGGDVDAAAQAVPEAARAAQREGAAALRQAMASGRYVDLVPARAQFLTGMMRLDMARPPVGPLNLIPLNIIGLFLLGFYAGRTRLVQASDRRGPLLRRIVWIGVGIGLPLNLFGYWLIYGAPPLSLTEATLFGIDYRSLVLPPGSVALGCAYLAALLLILRDSRWRTRLDLLGVVGRMGFTNYLVNLLLIAIMVYTFGLQDDLGRFNGTLLALPFFAGQMFYSRWWLARFRFGPVEWLWRWLSYGRRPAMRVARSSAGGYH